MGAVGRRGGGGLAGGAGRGPRAPADAADPGAARAVDQPLLRARLVELGDPAEGRPHERGADLRPPAVRAAAGVRCAGGQPAGAVRGVPSLGAGAVAAARRRDDGRCGLCGVPQLRLPQHALRRRRVDPGGRRGKLPGPAVLAGARPRRVQLVRGGGAGGGRPRGGWRARGPGGGGRKPQRRVRPQLRPLVRGDLPRQVRAARRSRADDGQLLHGHRQLLLRRARRRRPRPRQLPPPADGRRRPAVADRAAGPRGGEGPDDPAGRGAAGAGDDGAGPPRRRRPAPPARGQLRTGADGDEALPAGRAAVAGGGGGDGGGPRQAGVRPRRSSVADGPRLQPAASA